MSSLPPDSDDRDPHCDRVAAAWSELLLAAADVDRDPQRLDPLLRHLADCRRCRDEHAAFAELIGDLKTLPSPPTDPRRLEALRAALSSEPSRREARVRLAEPVSSRHDVAPIEWAALATVALVLAGGLLRYSPAVARCFATAPSNSEWLLPMLFLGFGSVLSLIALPLLRTPLLHAAAVDGLPPSST